MISQSRSIYALTGFLVIILLLQSEAVWARFIIRFKNSQSLPQQLEFRLNANLSGCNVYIDGRFWGETPLRLIKLEQGTHLLRVEKQGYDPFVKQFELNPEGPDTVSAIMKKKEAIKYHLVIRSNPRTAKINILNKEIHYMPNMELTRGKYHIEVSAEGYRRERRWIDLDHNLEIEIGLKEIAKPQEIKRTFGMLSVTANIDNAFIFIDGRKVGVTPLSKFQTVPGKKHILIGKEGYRPFEKTVVIKQDETKQLNVKLWSARKTKLFFKLNPPGAEIEFLDLDIQFKQGMALPSGDYFIEARAPEYKSKVLLVSLDQGVSQTVNITLDPLKKKPETDEQFSNTGYMIQKSGILLDVKANQEWIAVKDNFYNWHNARSWAENLDLQGGRWRLPTLDELAAVCKSDEGLKTIKQLSNNGRYFWTSEVKGVNSAWLYDLGRKKPVSQLKNYARGCYTLAVRKRLPQQIDMK